MPVYQKARIERCIKSSRVSRKIAKSLNENFLKKSKYALIKNRSNSLLKGLKIIKKKWQDERFFVVIRKGHHPYFTVKLYTLLTSWAGISRRRFRTFKIFGPSCVMKLETEMKKIAKEYLLNRVV